MKDQKLKEAQRKFEITEKLHKLGYEYKTRLWDDGTICTHKFIRQDCMRDSCYWEVAIEDHTDDDGEDYLIFVSYHDPDQKDWDGRQIDISGCVEFEAMKLIVEFTEILKKENKDESNTEFHCGVEESGGHAYNCNDCSNKCDEWYQWDKEMKNDKGRK